MQSSFNPSRKLGKKKLTPKRPQILPRPDLQEMNGLFVNYRPRTVLFPRDAVEARIYHGNPVKPSTRVIPFSIGKFGTMVHA